jgi:hypothetical protein
MSTELIDFIKNIQQVIQTKSYSYVFFDDDGKIEKISNKTSSDDQSKYIKVLTQNIDDIFTGKRRIEDYKVLYNLQKDLYELRFLNEEIIVPYIGDKIYQIPQVVKSQIYSYDLTVRQNLKDKCWNFFFNKNVKNISKMLFFSITAKNDPNILYRTILVNTDADDNCVSIPFKFEKESDSHNISVFTNKVLKKYSYEVFK